MSTTTEPETLADLLGLLERLGGISPDRVRLKPLPGTATEDDLLTLLRRTDRLYELVEGVLVEKVMGMPESLVAAELLRVLGNFVVERDLGKVAGADGVMRLTQGLVRIPDVSYMSWAKFPQRRIPRQPIPELTPDLAAEVLSEGNTPREMERKVREYFLSGAELVWLIDPAKRVVQIHAAPDRSLVLTEADTLDGSSVLPGFSLPVRQLFRDLEPETRGIGRSPRRRTPKKRQGD